MNPNERLAGYLRSLGLAEAADAAATQTFFTGLRGMQATIANLLNYSDSDQQARTTCDLGLRALGVNPETLEQLAPEPTPERQAQTTPPVDAEAIRAEALQQERARRTSIEQYGTMAGCSAEFVREILDGEATVEQAREQIFADHQARERANVAADLPSQAPAGHVRGGLNLLTIQAASLHMRGLDPTTQWADNDNGTPRLQRMTPERERAIDDGWKHRAASLEDFIRMAAAIDGVNLPTGRNGLLQNYLSGRSSTAALSAIFTTNVNSELLAAHDVAEDTTQGWTRESDVGDFRSNERARMENGGALTKLPRGGTADHATYSDTVESFQIARYASQFVIDDQDIQDDNFGGVSGFVPADMGVAARQLRPDLVYTILMGNPNMRDAVALFHAATHSNLQTSSALSIATLSSGRKTMRLQTEGGRNLNISGKYLIVPPALAGLAETLVESNNIVSGNTTGLVDRNPNAGKGIQVVVDARLENGVTDPTDATGATVNAGSATTWFLASEPSNHTIEVAYLRGTGRAPAIRPFVLTEGRWGLGWDVKVDIGAKALDWRGLQKTTA